MTHPPQPPPPPGGPPQGGFGPPSPPPPSAPYGGYQQQPYGGVPTMPPGGPSGGPSGGGGKKLNSQMVIIIAAVVAVVLIIGGGVWYAKSGDDGRKDETKHAADPKPSSNAPMEKVPSDPSAKQLFKLPPVKSNVDRSLSIAGSWLQDDVYAKSSISKVVGYNAEDGKELWTLPLTGPVCAASRQVTEDGLAAVVFESAKSTKAEMFHSCSEIAVFDLKSGDKLWQKSFKQGDEKVEYGEVVISADTVAVGGSSSGAGGGAFDAKTGKELWSPRPGDACKDAGYAGGEQLIAVRQCGSSDNPQMAVQPIDPRSGAPKWSYKLPRGINNAKVISTKPVVVGVDSSDVTVTGVTDIFAFDGKGKLRSKAALDPEKYEFDCGTDLVQDCSEIVVGNDRVYVPTFSRPEDYGLTNEIVSFDLATGKPTADKLDAGDGSEMFPMRMDGSNILAFKDAYGGGAQVVSIDPKTGKQTVLLETPSDRATTDAVTSFGKAGDNERLYSDGKFFMAQEQASDDLDSASGFGPKPLAVGFGTN